ncbi:MAG: amidase family protein, partial [Gammaproteobacteria bacterium]
MDEVDLCYLSATEALAKFHSRELSPVDVVKAQIRRNEKVGDQLNATTYTFFERALKDARAAEAKYQKTRARRLRPLEGVTVGIKDFHSIKGEITTYGSKVYANHRPDQTAPTVERLLKAGAILLLRTTTPEFAYSGITRSPLWGVTRNPWNPACTPGGSSGGASAAIAAGLVTLCDGTDGGGSNRIPAAFGGVVGYKPPFGRNPMDREHPLENLLHYGPIVRSVGDAALMQNVMSGQHVADMCSLRESLVLPDTFEAIRGMKIAYTPDYGFMHIAPDVARNTRAMVSALKRLGARVEEVDLGWNWGALDTWMTRWEGAFAGVIG